LRPYRQRPSGRNATDKTDEFTPSHSLPHAWKRRGSYFNGR
jgi:hypothetical protein